MKNLAGVKPQRGAWFTLLNLVITHQTKASIWSYNAGEIAAGILHAADVDLTLEGSLQPDTKAIIVQLLSEFAKAAHGLDFYTDFLESRTVGWEKADAEKLLALIPTAILMRQTVDDNFDFFVQAVNDLDILKSAYAHAKLASTIDGPEDELEAWDLALIHELDYNPDNWQEQDIASLNIIAPFQEVSCEQILAYTGHDWKLSKGEAGQGQSN